MQNPTAEDSKKEVCLRFSHTGRCSYGDRCKYAHVAPAGGAVPPRPRNRNVNNGGNSNYNSNNSGGNRRRDDPTASIWSNNNVDARN